MLATPNPLALGEYVVLVFWLKFPELFTNYFLNGVGYIRRENGKED
jgi:hypothetical protein